ncbi:MAG: helix-hairpin-helix domain-containing protein, partial [Methanoregula sp.]
NAESLLEMPSMTTDLIAKARSRHIYTVAEIARSPPETLAKVLDLAPDKAAGLQKEAEVMLEKLRRRSECRKFMRNHLIPRKGRSYAKIMTTLKEAGVTDLATLASASPETLKKAGVGESEATQLLTEAQVSYNGQVLKEIGIPAISLKKYIAHGIITPEAFCSTPPATLSSLTGMGLSTVHRHVGLVCAYLKKPAPVKLSKQQIERGRKELLAVSGLGATVVTKLFDAGIFDHESLLRADAGQVSTRTGIPVDKIRGYQALIKKKRENAVIRI